jgi:hypothetical protein
MSEVKKEIIFNNSMTIDKRAENFAYLRKNCLDLPTKGLYPSAGFRGIGWSVPAAYHVRFLDTDSVDENGNVVKGLTVIENETTDIVRVLETTTGTQIGSDITSAIFRAAARDDDGYLHLPLAISGTEKMYVVYGSSISDEGSLSNQTLSPYLGKFDGLWFYWTESSTGSDIFRSAPQSETVSLVFDDIGFRPIEFDFYGDQMVLFGQDLARKDIYIVFWDKSNSTVFDKRIIEKNARFIAGGVVDGRLMLIKAIGNSTNLKETGGRISVTVYDGEKFVEINSIKVASDLTKRSGFRRHQSSGNGVFAFGVTGNEDDQNPELYQNYLYKVYADGRIETLWSAEGDSSYVVNVGYEEIAFVQSNLDFSSGAASLTQLILTNKDTSNGYADYENFDETVYITNFLNEPYNFHKLDSFAVAFEKLFEQTDPEADPVTGEELDVYYRVSERDEFELLMNVTVEKVKNNVNVNRDQSDEYESDTVGLPEQRYMITSLPDDTPLPSFNEIQFKFVSKRGFSIIGAWYGYSYLSRNTLM